MSDFVFKTFEREIQNEALANEFKGNLLEFLVAQTIASSAQVLSQFYLELPANYQIQLSHYENWLKQHDPELHRKLPTMAHKTADQILKNIEYDILRVILVGKISNSSDAEADFILHTSGPLIKVSLKLCKVHSFVNTKSAGVKSFIGNYFSNFEQAPLMQSQLNELLDTQFSKMALSLHEIAGLAPSNVFGDEWRQNALPELPGELSEEMSEIVGKYYHDVIKKIYQCFCQLEQMNTQEFRKSLMPLIGHSSNDVLQVIAFHLGHEIQNFQVNFAHQGFKHFDILPLKEQISSFEMMLDNLTLQIRVKPMNKFTTPGLKINCSIKYRSSL